jgi:hypothetical protein
VTRRALEVQPDAGLTFDSEVSFAYPDSLEPPDLRTANELHFGL